MQPKAIQIETPEKILFRYEIAKIGSRMAAWIIDFIIQIIVLIGLMLLLVSYSAYDATSSPNGGYYLFAFYMIILFFMQWGYYIFFETILNGQTPGKKIIGIAVIEKNGGRLRFSTIVFRNLIRVIDGFPGCYFIGGCVSLFDRYSRRVGDMIAGTCVIENQMMVIKEPSSSVLFSKLSEDSEKKMKGIVHHRLNEEELWVLRKFLNEKQTLSDLKQTEIAWVIAEKLKERVEGKDLISDPIEFIEKVYKEHTNDTRK